MAQYISKDALLAEIEKIIDKGKYHDDYNCVFRDGNNAALYALKERIDTLEVKEVQEEPVSEDFEKALANEWKAYNDRGAATVDALEDNTQELAFAKGFYRGANWKEQKDSIVSDNLEEAIGEYCSNPDNFATWIGGKENDDILLIIKAIKFGAKWQRVKDQSTIELAEDHAMLAGMEKMKEQMIANAIEGEVLENYDGKVIKYDEMILDKKLSDCKVFDKVKIIIIKED